MLPSKVMVPETAGWNFQRRFRVREYVEQDEEMMMTVLDQYDRIHASPVPSVGRDLVESATALAGSDVAVERLLATLELLRHGEITLDQAAIFSGQSRERLARVMQTLEKVA